MNFENNEFAKPSLKRKKMCMAYEILSLIYTRRKKVIISESGSFSFILATQTLDKQIVAKYHWTLNALKFSFIQNFLFLIKRSQDKCLH